MEATMLWLVNEVRGLKHVGGQETFLVEIDAEKQREMRRLENCTVELNKLVHGHAISERHERPCEDIAGGNIGEEGITFCHGYRIDGKREAGMGQSWSTNDGSEDSLVLLARPRRNGHEGIAQDSDEHGSGRSQPLGSQGEVRIRVLQYYEVADDKK
jgi:hypothetical protein